MIGPRLSSTRLLALFAGLLLTAGCGKDEPAPTPPAPPTEAVKPTVPASEKKPINLATAKPDFTPDPKAWYTEWTADDRAAREKYEQKVLEISGEVSEVTAKLDSNQNIVQGMVVLKAGKEGQIRCFTTDTHPWDRISPGSKVKVRGIVPQYAEFPALDSAIIVEAGPNPAMTITAEQLAKELDEDADQTNKRYKDKFLIVEGEVLQKRVDPLGITWVYLKGVEEVPVACKFPHLMRTAAEPLKAGQKIKVIGLYRGWVATDKALELTQAMLFK